MKCAELFLLETNKQISQNRAFFLHPLGRFSHTLLLSTNYALSNKAPAEEAGMCAAWSLPRSVFVQVGSEDVNRLYNRTRLVSWQQRGALHREEASGPWESGWSEEQVGGVQPVFTRKGHLGESSQFMQRIQGNTAPPWGPRGTPGERQQAPHWASETPPRLRGVVWETCWAWERQEETVTGNRNLQ